MANKVTFGLKNTHYAPFEVVDGEIIYETPIPLPGSVELTLDPRGDLMEFYADDIVYYSSDNNQGYEGTLTVAKITDEFLVEVLGQEEDEQDGVITEVSDAKTRPFALMFEFDGDEKAVRHVLYNCTANRPTVASSTKTATVEPNTNELTFVASPRETDYAVKTKTTTGTPQAIYDAWYDAVYESGGVGGGVEG